MNKSPSTPTETTRESRGSWITWIPIAVLLFILLRLFFPVVTDMPTPGSWRCERARNDAMQLTIALKAYYSEFGTAPTGTHSDIIHALQGSNPTRIVFYENPKRLNASGELLDPWGVPYHIDTADPANPRIYSFGPNKRDDGAAPQSDDVSNFR